MKPLIETNRYLAAPAIRKPMMRRSVLESSYFAGARGVKLPPSTDKTPRRKAPTKKSAKGK